jgi:hypothetical protein
VVAYRLAADGCWLSLASCRYEASVLSDTNLQPAHSGKECFNARCIVFKVLVSVLR